MFHTMSYSANAMYSMAMSVCLSVTSLEFC